MRDMMVCALNGTDMVTLDDRIYIEDIHEVTDLDQETAKRAGYGLFPLNEPNHKSITVTITFMVKEKIRFERNLVIHKVMAWAKKGWLTTNVQPGRRLYVFCTKPPSIETYDWTGRAEVQFTAYGEAYWQDITPVSVASSEAVASAAEVFKLECSHDSFLEAVITPAGGTLTTCTITVGTRQFKLTGLSIAQNTPLLIYYDELHLLHIESGGTSLLSKRSGDSADDLILTAGINNSIGLVFNTTCNYTLSIRRLWE